jgi:hypothetical protein
MKIMISTPAYGGLLTVNYVTSLLNSLTWAASSGVEVHTHFQDKESLIPRARDRAAHHFLGGDCDKLLTIDADIEWSVEDFHRIIFSPYDIVGGVYSLKGFPTRANFNKNPDGSFRHIPTGFLCVTRRVFNRIRELGIPSYKAKNATGQTILYDQYYPSGVKDGEFMSEDWGLCELARGAGFLLHLDERIKLGHVGSHVYRTGQGLTSQGT